MAWLFGFGIKDMALPFRYDRKTVYLMMLSNEIFYGYFK